MTDERGERTPDPLIELLPELASWEPRSRDILLWGLVAYAEKQYRAAGEPHGESSLGLMRWLVRELTKDGAETVARLALEMRNATELARQIRRDLPGR